MRFARLAVLSAILASPTLPAAAYGVSQVHFSIQANTPMASCQQRVRDVLERSGLRILGTGSASVGAEPQDNSTLVTGYCIPGPGVVLMTVAGENTQATAPVLEQIRQTWTGRPATSSGPGPRITK